VTNAIKYAYPDSDEGRLLVALTPSEEPGKSLLTISDEGVGFDASAVSSGTGTRLIDGSVRQLDGTYEFQSQAGTQFSATVTLV
jgi:two-component system, sensor histidine kinase PdtaS